MIRRVVGALVALLALPVLLAGQSTPPTATPAQADYLIRFGDVLSIRIWPDAQLGGEFPVEESGKAYLPMIGEIHAAGRTLDDLRGQLRRLYGEALKSPVVSVTPLFRVSLFGAVASPGLYRIDPTQSLLDVVSQAGGFRSDAQPHKVRIVREGRVLEINAGRSLNSGGDGESLALQSGDRIVVPSRSRLVTVQNLFYVLQSAIMVATLVELSRR